MKSKALIFGTGEIAQKILPLVQEEHEVIAFIDNDENKWSSKFIGLPIHCPDRILEIDYDVIIVATVAGCSAVLSQLFHIGIGLEKIVLKFLPIFSNGEGEWFIKNRNINNLPTPPFELMEYRESSESHLESGKYVFDNICNTLRKNNIVIQEFKRVFEFGCNNCRVLRHFIPINENISLWGADVLVDRINWAMQNLPKLHLIVNNITPPLPFADGFFDFVYAYSVFTHLTDYHTAWFAELARTVKPGGYAYISFHDNDFLQFMEKTNHFFVHFAHDHELYMALKNAEYDFLHSVKRGYDLAEVFMSHEYIKELSEPFFEIVDRIPASSLWAQTAYLFKRI